MKIYIDGSCRPSTKLGAYCVMVISDNGEKRMFSGKREGVTNNMMELLALIEALKLVFNSQLDKKYEIEIFSDSQYVVKGINEWWVKWKKNNYKTTTGDVKNIDYWKQLELLTANVKYKLSWIKGHATSAEHNEVDRVVFSLTAP